MFFQMPACRYWKNIFIGFPCKKLNFYGLWRNKELCQNDTIAPDTFIEPWNVNILLS